MLFNVQERGFASLTLVICLLSSPANPSGLDGSPQEVI